MNNINWSKVAGYAVAFYAAAELAKELFQDKDTVNYELRCRRMRVYHGICYADRLDARLAEHERNGVVFDSCIYDEPTTREHASATERKRIRRDRPKYNMQHNSW